MWSKLADLTPVVDVVATVLTIPVALPFTVSKSFPRGP